MTTKERLKEFVFKNGYGQNAFEKYVDIANGYLASKSNSITSDTIEKILIKFPNLNLDWLFTGEGEMLIEDNSAIIERFKRVIHKNKITDEKLCEILDIPLTKWKKIYNHKIDFDINPLLDKVAEKFPEFSMTWLRTGQGYMMQSDADLYADNEDNINNSEMTKIHKPTKYMEKILESQEIMLYDINAAANLKTLFAQKNQNILDKIVLPNIPKCDGAVYVTGDSMEPFIKSGDIICYKEVDISSIVYGEIYLISIDMNGDEYLVVKYINRSDKGVGWIRLESLNERHYPQDYELKYVNAIALVKISIRKHTM